MSKGPAKRVAIEIPQKVAPPSPEAFVSAGKETLLPPPAPAASSGPAEPTKRLTIDIVESLHKRIRLHCAENDVKMTDLVRDLLEARFPAPGNRGG